MRKVIFIVIAIAVVVTTLKNFRSTPDTSEPDWAAKMQQDATSVDAATHSQETLQPAWPPLQEGAPASPSNNINYYIVFDGSGSMLSRDCGGGKTKIEAAVQAVKDFVVAIPATANVGLMIFDRHDISERVTLGLDNRNALIDALQKVRAGSGTPLRSSIQIGYDKLTEQAGKQLGYGEYHLVVVTDGRPDPRSEDPSDTVLEILATSPVVLHTIGFCIDPDHVLNQQGRTYYASANSPQELQQGLQAVLAEAPVFDAAGFK
jgi:Ca-activated chloride channel homolog